jgi:hypothetical protein
MTFPLTREEVSLIAEALQLIGNDAASLLKNRLLSHYSSYFHPALMQEEVQEWRSPFLSRSPNSSIQPTDQVSFFFNL